VHEKLTTSHDNHQFERRMDMILKWISELFIDDVKVLKEETQRYEVCQNKTKKDKSNIERMKIRLKESNKGTDEINIELDEDNPYSVKDWWLF
jgi:hypothetical protein